MAEVEEKPFDPQAYILQRNAADNVKLPGSAQPAPKEEPKKEEPKAAAAPPPAVEEPEVAPVEKPKEEPPPVVPVPAKEPDDVKLSRSQRREMNRLREEIGAERGRREAMESQLAELRARLDRPAAQPVVDEEPKSEAFNTEVEYLRALTVWMSKKTSREEVAKARELAEAKERDLMYSGTVSEMNARALEDRKLFPDWEDVMEGAQDEDYQFNTQSHPNLVALFNLSKSRELVRYYLAHPENKAEWLRFLALSGEDKSEQIRQFHQLEGKVEHLYRNAKAPPAEKPKVAEAQAAQASPKVEEPEAKDRTHPAEGQKPGRNAEPIPKPSSEVVAPGGSAPPDKPEPGTVAWRDMRNRMQYARD